MVRHIVLLLIALPLAASVATADPNGGAGWIGALINNGAVQVEGVRILPGGARNLGAGWVRPRSVVTPTPPPPPPTVPSGLCAGSARVCVSEPRGAPPRAPAPPAPAVPGAPVVTLRDIAEFRPTPAPPGSEPAGWGVVGLETNFVASDAAQTVPGTLLGRPASVLFTPTGYRWDYGDGSIRSSAGPGASWSALGVREFDATGTSHAYRDRGSYTVALTVEYSAAYSWDGSAYTPIEGTLTVPAGTMVVRILVESTVLVGSDCAATPTGPGC